MTLITSAKDLVVLTADKNAEWAMRGILSRYRSLGIRPVSADYYVHPERDPGCVRKAQDFLAPFAGSYDHALVVLDSEGCGQESVSRMELEADIEDKLGAKGWGDRAAAIVVVPELEVWVWSTSPHVPTELGWEGTADSLREWLNEKGYLQQNDTKPSDPKGAVEACLRRARKPRSSTLYKTLAEKVSLSECNDQAFVKLKEVLRTWFACQE